MQGFSDKASARAAARQAAQGERSRTCLPWAPSQRARRLARQAATLSGRMSMP